VAEARSLLCLDCQLAGRPEPLGRPPREPRLAAAPAADDPLPTVRARRRFAETLQAYSLHPLLGRKP
jgi:hypothetical protein